jgi:RNase P subunit RPR2
MNLWQTLFPPRCANCNKRLKPYQIILVRLIGKTEKEVWCHGCIVENRQNLKLEGDYEQAM